MRFSNKVNKIVYGGDYNPEQWPEEIWADDMRLLKEANIDIVTLNVFSWAALQPSEETYDFSKLDKIMEMVRDNGLQVCLATSKPEKFSVRILEKFGVDKYFDFIGAASFDSSRSSKLAVIQYVLENTGAKPEECLMVGDRMHDIVGAHDAGIKCAAVLVGFGSRGEFAEYGADYVCETLDDVLKLV